jgi:plastocyanin
MAVRWVIGAFGAGAVLVTAWGCGSGGDSGPSQSSPKVEKTSTKSGDVQTGPINAPLPNPLRVVVTRDGNPVRDVSVNWSSSSGTFSPSDGTTGGDGVSSTTWTFGPTPGPQTAVAHVTGAMGSPVTFTATATGSGVGATVQVLSSGGNRFSPQDVTVTAGSTVTWAWENSTVKHNVVPDDGTTPPTSGAITGGPNSYAYTFTTPGIYHYHCAAHGAVNGIGMSGTITVSAGQP